MGSDESARAVISKSEARRRKRAETPAFLVKEVKVQKDRWGSGESAEERTLTGWHTLNNRADVEDVVATMERPGFGSEYESVRYEVFRIVAAEPEAAVEVQPMNCRDHALKLVAYGSNGCTRLGLKVRVDVGLRGRGWDPPAVFWDSHGNSFAVVLPREGQKADARLTWDQGVMLLSINGNGEIRWDVDPTGYQMPENREAIEYFGLTSPRSCGEAAAK